MLKKRKQKATRTYRAATNYEHKSYLGQELTKCPSCGGRVILTPVKYALVFICQVCDDHYLYSCPLPTSPRHEPAYLTPEQARELYG